MIKSYSSRIVKSDLTNSVVRSATDMADRKPRPNEDTIYIVEQDRLAILARMDEKVIKKSALAVECDVSGSAITLLLSKPIAKGKTRGCRFATKLQRALGFALTNKSPAVLPRESVRRAQQVIDRLKNDPEGLENWLRQGEWNARKAGG